MILRILALRMMQMEIGQFLPETEMHIRFLRENMGILYQMDPLNATPHTIKHTR